MHTNAKLPNAVRATLVGMPPLRAPAITNAPQTRSQLTGLATGGADDGASLSAYSVQQICHDYLDLVVESHHLEQRAEDAARDVATLRGQLAAARAANAALQRQVEIRIQSFELSELSVLSPDPEPVAVVAQPVAADPKPDRFDEPTQQRRAYAATVRRSQMRQAEVRS